VEVEVMDVEEVDMVRYEIHEQGSELLLRCLLPYVKVEGVDVVEVEGVNGL
jgi:uncharacterized protein (UPF0262 family)